MERKEMIKNNKGITLVALVITIIILLILAGVSINIVFDEDGIIERAKQAAENMEIAANEEQMQLSQLLNEINHDGEKVQYAPYDNPYIPTGFTHTEGTWNNGYTIKDGLGNEFVWVPCVINQGDVRTGDRVVTLKKYLPTSTATTDTYYKYNKENLTITGDEGNIAYEIQSSVAKYGGFYIAKYEAGLPIDEKGNEIGIYSAIVTQKARSVAGATTWTYISRANAILAAENMVNTTDGVKSVLITGEAWDTTLQWMVNTAENSANEPNAGYDIDSTGNGWYGKSNEATTGQYPINNIYDMAGNVYEWTTENCTWNGSSYLVARGGFYNNSGSDRPASVRNAYSGVVDSGIGFRVVLYK